MLSDTEGLLNQARATVYEGTYMAVLVAVKGDGALARLNRIIKDLLDARVPSNSIRGIIWSTVRDLIQHPK